MSRNLTKEFSFMSSLNSHGQENKRSPALTDTDKMPWGKYKDELMQDVPASYLAWLWNDADEPLKLRSKELSNAIVHGSVKLANYIWNSRNALNQELGETKIA